ncbi:MAG: GtrA family protein [Bacillota bacterium]
MALILENYLNRTNTFIRFLLVGFVNTSIGFSLILVLLNIFGLSYWFSTFIGNSLGALVSYTLNKNFTFKSEVDNKRGFTLFILVILGCYIISYQLGYKIIYESNLINLKLYRDELSVFIAAVIYTILNYFGQRYLTFRT